MSQPPPSMESLKQAWEIVRSSPNATTLTEKMARALDDARVPVVLQPGDVYILFAAMLAMVHDIHAAQDNFTEQQWARAATLFEELRRLVEGQP